MIAPGSCIRKWRPPIARLIAKDRQPHSSGENLTAGAHDASRRSSGCSPRYERKRLQRRPAVLMSWLRQHLAPAQHSSTALGLFREGVLERIPRRWRTAARADHVDEGAQRGRDLPLPVIVEEQSLEARRPFLEDADQLPRAQE